MKKWLYIVFVNNRVVDFLSSSALSMVIPPIVGLYYGTLDIWGDQWSWVKDYIEIHEIIFSVLAAFTFIVLFIKGLAEAAKGKVTKRYEILMESLIVFFNELVKKKKDRFYQKAKILKPNADAFKVIEHPDVQLGHVLDGTRRFLTEGLKIDPKNIGITIIQGCEASNRWWYALKCDSQKLHTKARELMQGGSTARYCLESGDSLFIPDIRKGIKEGVFFESNRSKKSKTGSIFCKPVRVNVNSIDYIYIFTVAVYGQYICAPYDEQACRACEKILDEVADRVELELYLHSMKQYRESGGKAA